MSSVLAGDALEDPDAAALADGDRLGARDQPAVDAHVERRAGDLVQGDDRSRAEASRELAQVHAGATELDRDVERHVMEQGFEPRGLECIGGIVVTHQRFPLVAVTTAVTSIARTPRDTTGRPYALMTSPQYSGTGVSTKLGKVNVSPGCIRRSWPRRSWIRPSSTRR